MRLSFTHQTGPGRILTAAMLGLALLVPIARVGTPSAHAGGYEPTGSFLSSSASGGMWDIEITRHSDHLLYVHERAHCGANDCTWDPVPLVGIGFLYFATFHTGFAVRVQTLIFTDYEYDGLRAITTTHFTDHSGRQDYTTDDRFDRVAQ
jgi:hypothetical protein